MKEHPYKILVFTLMLFIAGCSVPRPPVYTVIPNGTTVRPKVALVLGGGAARGFAHIGVIRVLERERIPIDLIVGTSVGSLIGAIYAAHRDSFELEWIAFSLQREDIFDFSLFSSKTGPVKGDKLETFINDHISIKDIEEFSIPYCAVAADLNTGEPVVFDRGPVAKAVRASSSIPGVFTPLVYEEKTLVDGGVLGNLAPEIARQKGADIVIAVDIGRNVVNQNTNNLIDIILQAISIMSNKIDSYKRKDADVVIAPNVGDVGMMDFTRKKECMVAGMEAAREAMPAIQSLLSPSQ